jgi:sortase A
MKLRRWFANFFLLAGVLAILFSAGAIATAVVWQDWQNWVFDRESRNEPATISGYIAGKKDRAIEIVREWRGLPSGPKPSTVHPGTAPEPERPRAIAKNEILGRLTIQRLHLSAMVREGDEENTLSLALGHIPGTALPGQTGNVGIAGHRDTLFRGLRNVRKDDLIQFETLAGTHMYKVGSIEIVKPQDVGVLDPGRNPELTLVTCYPFYYVGSAPDRFIVKAQEVSTESAARPVEEPPATAHKETVAFSREPDERRPASGKISFNVSVGHSRQLAPGISLGVTETDPVDQRVKGWMWLMPDRRTIWLRNQSVDDPVVFYGYVDGRKREVLITSISKTSVTGYLMLPGE